MTSRNPLNVSDVPLEALGFSQPNGVLPEKIVYVVDEDAFLFKKNPQKVRKNPHKRTRRGAEHAEARQRWKNYRK